MALIRKHKYLCKAPIVFDRVRQLDCFALPLDEITSDDIVTFDLSCVNFIKPPGVIGILVAIETLLNLGERCPDIRIFPPSRNGVLDYLLKINFVDALRQLCSWEIPTEHLISPTSVKMRPVIPITRFKVADDVEDLANQMNSTFRTDFIGLETLLEPCHVIFSELADNVLHHAGSNGGFVLAQQYNYASGPLLEIAIGDSGLGIPISLAQNPDLASKLHSDQEAISLALQDGVTRFAGKPYRGYGLGYIHKHVEAAQNRMMTVRSGSGYVIIGYSKQDRYTWADECRCLTGTLAHVVLPCG
jgi:hypothetical protein